MVCCRLLLLLLPAACCCCLLPLLLPAAAVAVISAHNVTPQMGQGCNSALEDAALLDQALRSSSYNIKDGLQQFQHKRKPQASLTC